MKPYIIINIVDGMLDAVHLRTTYEEALDCAVKMAQEQCPEETMIREEIQDDWGFWSADESIKVEIRQPISCTEQPDPVCGCGKTSVGICPRCGQNMD